MNDRPEDFRLENFLPYLVHRVGSRLADGFGVEFDAAGVSLQEWRALAVLHEYGALTMGEIARRTSIPPASMTRLVAGMENRKLVKRERTLGNQRSVHVRLLHPGRSIVEELIPRVIGYEKSLSACFSPSELQMFKTLLARLFFSFDEESGNEEKERGRLAG